MTQPGARSTEIRPAVFQELDTLLSIDASCFPSGIAYPRKEIAALLRAPAVLTMVAERSQGIVGFASLGSGQQRRSSHSWIRGELITMDVLPEVRREHVGWQLHRALEEEFRMRGGKNIELHVAVDNAAAIAFYKRLNYGIVGRVPRYYLNSVDAWRMEKAVSDSPQRN